MLVKQCLTLNLEIKRKEPGVKDARTTISKVRPGVAVEDREDNIGFEEHELDVTIRKRNPKESFGISIGSTNHGTSLIVGVAPRGPADGLLRADDEIKSIDGTLVKGLPHPRVLDLFKDKQALKLRVLRKHEVAYANRLDEAQANPEEAAHIAQRSSFGTSETANVRVTLRRRSVAESYGFGLGEADADFSPTGKIITHVSNSSPADQNLFPLDTLMRVDGVEVGQLSHAEVVDLIKRGTKVTLDVHRADPLKVQRAKSVSQVAPNLEVRGRQDDVGLNALPSQGNYLDRKVHIKRGPNEPCGFGIATTDGTRGPPAHVVSVVQPGSPADRSMLAVGDVITSLNDEPVGPLPHRDVVAKLGSMESFTLSVRRAQQRAFNKRASITKVAPDLKIAERDDEVVIVDVSCPAFAVFLIPLSLPCDIGVFFPWVASRRRPFVTRPSRRATQSRNRVKFYFYPLAAHARASMLVAGAQRQSAGDHDQPGPPDTQNVVWLWARGHRGGGQRDYERQPGRAQ